MSNDNYTNYYETVSACMYPRKSRSLQERALAAQQMMPQNIAHMGQIAATADSSVKRQLRSDDLIHGFAKSKSQCGNPLNNWRAELLVQPLHWPVQRPMDIGRDVQSQRIALYSQRAPVNGGYSASHMF